MADDENAGFALPRGATGFFRPQDGPLPETDPRRLRAALHAAARAAGGRVSEWEEREYPCTFHSATVVVGTAGHIVLAHAHHPWIAFARERRDWYTEQFLAPPPWSDVFTHAGFTVLGSEQLTMPLSGVDTSALTRDEWRHVRLYGITTLGGLLFNAWD
ncbi:hypothetical protein [Streptomyces sp. A012304]|uniref:hypothetical protein n=1 Tax=Streptomyces sp. A012304 TaxID=375446 RepID=UPI00222F1F7F|nr:hypothetical protein [Streptomyces sp. A012304]GKQ40545.1 hypothetical protein ALMP_70680 [Streptomyces sp. A012304]